MDVSRQAVSKWESGRAVPESMTLIAISEYFGITLDELMKDSAAISETAVNAEKAQVTGRNGRAGRIIGTVICLAGIVCLIVWGIVFVLMPSMSDQIGASSMITIDGNGIFLMACVAAIIIGAVFLLKSVSGKQGGPL